MQDEQNEWTTRWDVYSYRTKSFRMKTVISGMGLSFHFGKAYAGKAACFTFRLIALCAESNREDGRELTADARHFNTQRLWSQCTLMWIFVYTWLLVCEGMDTASLLEWKERLCYHPDTGSSTHLWCPFPVYLISLLWKWHQLEATSERKAVNRKQSWRSPV